MPKKRGAGNWPQEYGADDGEYKPDDFADVRNPDGTGGPKTRRPKTQKANDGKPEGSTEPKEYKQNTPYEEIGKEPEVSQGDDEENYKKAVDRLGKMGVKVGGVRNIEAKVYATTLNQVADLMEEYPEVERFFVGGNLTVETDSSLAKKGALAAVRTQIFNTKHQTLMLNPTDYRDEKALVSLSKDLQNRGWLTKTKDGTQNISTVTHEFGHIIGNILRQQEWDANPEEARKKMMYVMGASSQRQANERARKVANDIAKAHLDEIKAMAKKIDNNCDTSPVSMYASDSPCEEFAELFCKMKLGEQTPMTQAMAEFIKRRLQQ